MIRFLRRKRVTKRIFWTLCALVIPAFLWWGVGVGTGSKGGAIIARVDRQPISRQEYLGLSDKVYRQYRKFYPEEKLEDLKLEKMVLESLIREKIFIQEARKRRIRVSDKKIVDEIKKDPTFYNKDKKFDKEKFQRIVKSIPDKEWEGIEERVRKDLTFRRLREVILEELNPQIGEEEVKKYIKEKKLKGKEKDYIRQILKWEKEQKAFENWYKEKRNIAKVQIYINENSSQ